MITTLMLACALFTGILTVAGEPQTLAIEFDAKTIASSPLKNTHQSLQSQTIRMPAGQNYLNGHMIMSEIDYRLKIPMDLQRILCIKPTLLGSWARGWISPAILAFLPSWLSEESEPELLSLNTNVKALVAANPNIRFTLEVATEWRSTHAKYMYEGECTSASLYSYPSEPGVKQHPQHPMEQD